MSMRIKYPLTLAAAALALAAPAYGQTPAAAQAAISAGAVVKDTAGGNVGTIVATDAGFATVKTDRHEVRLPATSFTKVDTGYIIAMTQVELNAAVEKSLAEAAASLAAGAVVRDPQGGTVGTVEAVDAEFVTVKLAKTSVKLPRAAVAVGPTGPVIGNTAAELEAKAAAVAPAAEENAE